MAVDRISEFIGESRANHQSLQTQLSDLKSIQVSKFDEMRRELSNREDAFKLLLDERFKSQGERLGALETDKEKQSNWRREHELKCHRIGENGKTAPLWQTPAVKYGATGGGGALALAILQWVFERVTNG